MARGLWQDFSAKLSIPRSQLRKVVQDFSKIRTLDLFKMRAVFMVLIKGGSVQETLFHKFSAYIKFEFSFPVYLCSPFSEMTSSVSESLRAK